MTKMLVTFALQTRIFGCREGRKQGLAGTKSKMSHKTPSSGMWPPLLYLLSSLLPVGCRAKGRGADRLQK